MDATQKMHWKNINKRSRNAAVLKLQQRGCSHKCLYECDPSFRITEDGSITAFYANTKF